MRKKASFFTIFYKIRNAFWEFPQALFGKEGFFVSFWNFYLTSRPVSHIMFFSIIAGGISFFIYNGNISFAKAEKDVIIEGVVIGDAGRISINPLIPSANQLENDLSHLIYQGLVRVNGNGEPYGVLAKSWEKLDEEGKSYKFLLKDNVFWHDGDRFSADDVLINFEVLKRLSESGDSLFTSKYSEVARTLEVEKISDFEIKITSEMTNPTFFEDIDFGIMPMKILSNINVSTFNLSPYNYAPIGTGPFKYEYQKENQILLSAFDKYYDQFPKIKYYKIILFETTDEAVDALEKGNIHLLADPSTAVISDLSLWPKVQIIKSSTLYRRYWALYFNLKEGANTSMTDKEIRKAVAFAIDRNKIIEEVVTAGEIAYGTIPKSSFAFNEKTEKYEYDPEKSVELLKKAGWEKKNIEGQNLWEKDDNILRIELAYLSKYDREVIAENIKEDLEKIGIIVNLDPKTSSDLNEALIAPRNFDVVLYGVETPIDPDRIRLWHSDAIEYPGLNISSYSSSIKGGVIGSEKEIERISLSDAALENGVSNLDKEKRLGTEGINSGYLRFQELLVDDCPAVFLYHPVFTYAGVGRVKGIDLSDMTTPSDRYNSIVEWEIE